MAEGYLADPNLWDANVEHDPAVDEPGHDTVLLRRWDRLDPSRGVRLLDGATGTGSLARKVARRRTDVLAVDSSPARAA